MLFKIILNKTLSINKIKLKIKFYTIRDLTKIILI